MEVNPEVIRQRIEAHTGRPFAEWRSSDNATIWVHGTRFTPALEVGCLFVDGVLLYSSSWL